MRSKIVAQRYAKGLYTAIKKSEFEKIRDEFEKFLSVYNEMEFVRDFFSNMFYTKNQKIEVIEKISNTLKLDERLKRFFVLLVKKRRISMVSEIYDEFVKVWERESNIYPVEIISAKKLTNEEKNKIEKAFSKFLSGKLNPTYSIDEKLIGGVIVKVGSTYYDGSIKGALNKLKETIIKEN